MRARSLPQRAAPLPRESGLPRAAVHPHETSLPDAAALPSERSFPDKAPLPHEAARLSPAGLVFLRGRDADGRLRQIAALRSAARPLLGALAAALTARRAHEALGYRSLGDYAREHVGLGARTLREWARVWRALAELPLLRRALLEGELSWGAARLVVAHVTPETQAACLDCVRGRTLRAVAAIVAALKQALATPGEAPGSQPLPAAEDDAEERVLVRLSCTAREAGLWQAALELARRVAGEELPVWECAERIAAEAASALGRGVPQASAAPRAGTPAGESASGQRVAGEPGAGSRRGGAASGGAASDAGPHEHGLRQRAFPGLAWKAASAELPAGLSALAEDLDACTPRQLDARLRAAIAFLQSVDFELGRILRQMQQRGLFAELGFAGLARYVEERLDVSPRTARRLVALARSEHRAPALAHAFRRGRLHALQAQALAGVATLESARSWVERARQVTLRRLEDDLESRPRPAIAFRAPPEVAALFLEILSRAGSLERLLAHAVATWAAEGQQFRDYADFRRDGFRCTAPGCSARRNLHSHHIRFRSAGGPDAPWNRTTLCAHHHQRGVHGGTLRVRGRAPGALVFELGPAPAERFASGDLRQPEASA